MPELICPPPPCGMFSVAIAFWPRKVAASRAVTAIREGMRTIEAHPEAGRPAAKMDPEFREWPIGFGSSGYVVLYRPNQDQAVVLAVRHQCEAGYG